MPFQRPAPNSAFSSVRVGFAILALLLAASCQSSSPTRNTAERTRELICRESAKRACGAQSAEDSDSYALNQCIAKQAWDCIMGQTRSDMSERYEPVDLPGN